MTIVYWVLALIGLYPLVRAAYANRRTSLTHAIAWSAAAWLGWAWAILGPDTDQVGPDPAVYVALCFTSAAGIAVLNARRPYVYAWDFAVLALLVVSVWPLIESMLIGKDPVDPLRIFFLCATLAVGPLNYLPTRSAPAVLLLARRWRVRW